MKDITGEILSIKHALTRAYEDTDADGGIATALSGFVSNENLLLNLGNLIENEKWTSVILYFKCNREDFLREYDDMCERENDVLSILNIYCKKLVHDKPGKYDVFYFVFNICEVDGSTIYENYFLLLFLENFVVTNRETDLADVFGRLFQVSAAVSDLESVLKDQPSKSVDLPSK